MTHDPTAVLSVDSMKKALLAAGIVLILALGTWVYFTPYIALRAMRSAAQARDGNALAAYVDFPSVRESLKTGVSEKVASAAQSTGNPLAMFGAAFASALVDPMIDALVTPDSLALALNGVKPQPGAAAVPVPSDSDVETTTSYGDLNTFLVTVKLKSSATPPVGLVLSRSGLVSWRLSGVTLP